MTQKKLDKRIRLLKSAYEIFSKKGVNMTAIDDVVKAAGVAKGTFYLYFKDKYDLVDQVLISESRSVIHSAVKKLEEKLEETELSPAEQLIYTGDCITENLIANKPLVSLVCKNLSACCSLLFSTDDETTRGDIDTLLDILCAGGVKREDARKYLYIISDTLMMVFSDAILGNIPYSVEDMREQLHFMIKKLLS